MLCVDYNKPSSVPHNKSTTKHYALLFHVKAKSETHRTLSSFDGDDGDGGKRQQLRQRSAAPYDVVLVLAGAEPATAAEAGSIQ